MSRHDPNRLCFPYLVSLSTVVMLFVVGCCSELPIPPMHKAVRERNVAEVEMLIDKGANIDATDDLGRTPLYLAALHGYGDVVDLLLAKGANAKKGASWKGYDTPLHVASAQGHEEIVRHLVARGTDVNIKNWAGQTPLLYASWGGRTSVVDFLIAHGADVHVRDKHGLSALNLDQRPVDSLEGYDGVVRILISHGADVNCRAAHGGTPLMDASRVGSTAAVALLIAHGAAINARGQTGYTALHIAWLRATPK